MANRSSWDAGETMSDASINDCKYHFHFQNVSRLLVRVVIGFRILLKEAQGSLLPWSPCLRHRKIWKAVFWQQFKGLICFVPVKYTTVYFISADLGVCVSLGEGRKYGAVAVCRLKQRGLKLIACNTVDEDPRWMHKK